MVYLVYVSAGLVVIRRTIRKATRLPKKKRKARAHLVALPIILRKTRNKSTQNLTLMECQLHTILMIRIQS